MALPALSHHQYLALRILRDTSASGGWLSGKLLRERMQAHGASARSLAAWYQFFKRLVDAGFISARMEKQRRGTRTYDIRAYRVRRDGKKAMQVSREFYST